MAMTITSSVQACSHLTTRSLWVLLLLIALALGGQPMARSAGSSEVGRMPPDFGQPYTYADGVETQISEVWTGWRLGVPVVEFTVTVRNGTAHLFTTYLRGDLLHGPHRRPATRYVTPPGADDLGSVQQIAVGGVSDPYRIRYVLPVGHRDELVLVVAIDNGDHDAAVFTGAV